MIGFASIMAGPLVKFFVEMGSNLTPDTEA